jgi:hypothetical protein
MDLKFFISGIKIILSDPEKAWEIINSENRPVKVVRDSFFFPLIFLVSVSAVAGSLFFTSAELSPVYSIFTGIKVFILLYITTYATAYMIGEITYPLDLGRNFSISFRITVFSITPLLLCQILSRLFESLQFVNVLGLYGLYIFWTGAEKMLNPPQSKKMPLIIAATITMAGIYILSGILLKLIIDRMYYAFFA